ncbi:MAG: lipoate--protein ligase family protein [Cyanobacteria bacterium P01_H01_bin.153]
MHQQGRLISTRVTTGTEQMATDCWLLDQLMTRQLPPILRFYQWSPIALSLGYHQKEWPDHWRTLTWQGQPVELVRRPTGGRAVLHQGDLTYAIALPLTVRRQEAYRQICDALIAAWQQLGVELHYGTAGRSYRHQANCFALATAADLVTPAGYKLVGSAQLRRDRYLLQHGSIRLWPDATCHRQVFGENMAPMAERPWAIPSAPDETFLEQLKGLIQQALAQSLGMTFAALPLSAAEIAEIRARSSSLARAVI